MSGAEAMDPLFLGVYRSMRSDRDSDTCMDIILCVDETGKSEMLFFLWDQSILRSLRSTTAPGPACG